MGTIFDYCNEDVQEHEMDECNHNEWRGEAIQWYNKENNLTAYGTNTSELVLLLADGLIFERNLYF